ncbi:MAG: PEGA domain-containing protein [Bradymonadaceae bacterium]
MKNLSWICWFLLLALLSWPAQIAAEKQKEEQKEEPEVDVYREFVRANELAMAGALTRSIAHYQKVTTHAPERYPLAHFNLAEVQSALKNCAQATLLYSAYLALGTDEAVQGQARAGIRECHAGQKLGQLSVAVSPEDSAITYVDGYILARRASIKELALLPGTYEVRSVAPDHYPMVQTIEVKSGETTSLELGLNMQTFHGEVEIEVNKPGAKIMIHPRELDSPDGPTEVITLTSPMEEPLRLVTGKYFLEITRDDHHRWIRNIEVHRDQKTEVNVQLQRELPKEIR